MVTIMPSTPYNNRNKKNNSPAARGGMPLQPPPPPALLPDPPSTSRLTLRPHRHNPRRPRPVPLVSDLQLSELPSRSSPAIFTPRINTGDGGSGGGNNITSFTTSPVPVCGSPQPPAVVINTLIHLHISSFTPLSRRVKHDPQVVSVFLHPHLNAFDHHFSTTNADENVPDSSNAERTVAAPVPVSAASRARPKLKRHRVGRHKDKDRYGLGQQQQHHQHQQGYHLSQAHDHHGWTSVASISCLPAVISLPNTPTSYYLRLSFHNNKPSRHLGDATVPLHRVLHRPSIVVPVTHRGSTIALIFLRATKTVLRHNPNRPQQLGASPPPSSSLHSHPSVSSPSLSAASADDARATRINSSSSVGPSSVPHRPDVAVRHSHIPASRTSTVFPTDALALVSLSNSVCCHRATPAAAAAAEARGASLPNASPPWQRAGLSLAVRIAGSMATDARLVTAFVLSVAKGKHGKAWPAGRAALSRRAGRTACISAPADVLWFGVDSPRGSSDNCGGARRRDLAERGSIKDTTTMGRSGERGGRGSDDDDDDEAVDDEGWFRMEWISMRKQGVPFVHGSLKLGIKQLASLDKGQLLLMDWIEACGTPVVERTACIEHAAFRDGFWYVNLFLTR